jgi:hypothetical protein
LTSSAPRRDILPRELIIPVIIRLADALLNIIFSERHGFHSDELDIVRNARTLD